MGERSQVLSSLTPDERDTLERRLLSRQSGRCFICDEPIDLHLHEGQLDVDHIVPLAAKGPDDENNFALTHASCNRSKGASDLRVARRLAEFDRLQWAAQKRGDRGASLGDVLSQYGGARVHLRLRRGDDRVEFVLSGAGDEGIRTSPLYHDSLSGMDYFFAVLPLEYLHHDDRINPRPIGSNIRGLLEEFMRGNPQLHVALGWWAAGPDGSGAVKVFDGQHKAAAQILLGVRELPLRIFVQPDTNVLLDANTNAGGKLRQVAFDIAVMRHLGSTLYLERLRKYQQMKGLREDDYSFSEKDLTQFFRGERREMERYIIDAVRDSVIHNKDNRLMEFVEWSGKGADRPLAYAAVERTFFKEFLFKKALDIPIYEGMDRGENPRVLEREQLVRLMTLFADVFFVGQWDPDSGGRKLENRLQHGDAIPEAHLRAWRISREEILANVLVWVRRVVEHHYALTLRPVENDRLLHVALPVELWKLIEVFLGRVAALPCWIDKGLSTTVFGVKQNLDFWSTIFKTGKAPTGVQVLAQPLDLMNMLRAAG